MMVPSDYDFLVGPISFSGTNCEKNLVFQVYKFTPLSFKFTSITPLSLTLTNLFANHFLKSFEILRNNLESHLIIGMM